MFKAMFSVLNFKEQLDINEEKMEELKLVSGFKPKEIVRLRNIFKKLTNNNEYMDETAFLNIECIAINPLKDRIVLCFGFDSGDFTEKKINFEKFLCGVAAFNSPGFRQQKLRLAFRIQDFDDDGLISKLDLVEYINRITSGTLATTEVDDIVNAIMGEISTDPNLETISFADFQHTVAPLDFEAKLLLPI